MVVIWFSIARCPFRCGACEPFTLFRTRVYFVTKPLHTEVLQCVMLRATSVGCIANEL